MIYKIKLDNDSIAEIHGKLSIGFFDSSGIELFEDDVVERVIGISGESTMQKFRIIRLNSGLCVMQNIKNPQYMEYPEYYARFAKKIVK